MLRATSLTLEVRAQWGVVQMDRHDARTRRERDQWRHGLPGTQQRARARKAAATWSRPAVAGLALTTWPSSAT